MHHQMEVMINPSSHVVYSPKRFPQYYSSAPTTPDHHLSHFYPLFHDIQENHIVKKSVTTDIDDDDDSDFAFDVDENWETTSTSAEELFVGGVIKSMKQQQQQQPPPSKVNEKQSTHKTKNDMFFASAQNGSKPVASTQRGRETSTKSSSMRRTARSLSPLRDNKHMWREEEETEESGCSSGCASAVKAKKWRLKDLFLFRSASEGRAADKDPLKKYAAPSGSSWRRRKLPVSPHELHYTMNRAASNDLKKKTFLPYKQGILGRLSFNPAVHALANGFGLSRN